jgi:hypothetical protein
MPEMPTTAGMVERLRAHLPRVALFALVGLAATATLTYAAGRQLGSTPGTATTAAPAAPLVVPDVKAQAFVFAKGSLEDAGFAWKVVGSVHGFAANTVVSQSPAAGTRLVDTGAPLVILTLKRNGSYQQKGQAEDVSPYQATVVQPADLAAAVGPANPATTTTAAPKQPAAAPKPTTTPAQTTATTTATTTTTAAPATTATTTTPATTTTGYDTSVPAAKPVAAAKPAAPAKRTSTWPQSRPPAFTVPGGKKEPLDEMPLPERAAALMRWLDAHPRKTNANVKHWLYQHSWIVAGAKLGWWHGAQALATLIAADRRAEQLWGIGSKSALEARSALGVVQSRSK